MADQRQDRETDRLLGQLVAQGDELARQMEAAFRKLDAITTQYHEINGVAGKALDLSMQTSLLIKQEIQPVLTDYKNLKAKGAGVLGAVAVLGGGVATVAQKAWSAIMGAPH